MLFSAADRQLSHRHSANNEHHASQNPGIRQHTWHTERLIEKHNPQIHVAKNDGTNAYCYLAIGVVWTRGREGRKKQKQRQNLRQLITGLLLCKPVVTQERRG